MEKYKKVTQAVNEVGQPDQYGNKAFSIAFADGSSGFFKCKEQDLFVVGVESEFYMSKEVGKTGKEYSKIHRVSKIENPFEKKNSTSDTGSVKSKFNEDQINRSVAVKAVCQMRAGSSRDMQQVLQEAEILFDYIKFGVQDGPSGMPVTDGHQQALQPPISNEIKTDELPF